MIVADVVPTALVAVRRRWAELLRRIFRGPRTRAPRADCLLGMEPSLG